MSNETPDRANDYWCPKCKAHTTAIRTVMKNYYGGESGPRDKVIYKCSCGCREMYKPIDCSKDWKEFRKITAYLLGVSCVILTTGSFFLISLFQIWKYGLESVRVYQSGLFCMPLHVTVSGNIGENPINKLNYRPTFPSTGLFLAPQKRGGTSMMRGVWGVVVPQWWSS